MGSSCGNCGCRERDNVVEAGICNIEKLLRFDRFTAENFDATMRNYSRNHHLSQQVFAKVCVKLGIPYENHEDSLRIVSYFNQYKVKPSRDQEHEKLALYPEQDLIMLAIFLCKDKPNVKASILFEAIDSEAMETITREQFQTAMSDVFEVVVNRMTKLCTGKENRGFLNYNLLNSYCDDLEKGKERGIDRLTALIFDDDSYVEKEQFVSRLASEDLSWVLSTTGIRQHWYEAFVTKQFDFAAKKRLGLNTGKSLDDFS